MIRKTIIMALSILALVALVLGVASDWHEINLVGYPHSPSLPMVYFCGFHSGAFAFSHVNKANLDASQSDKNLYIARITTHDHPPFYFKNGKGGHFVLRFPITTSSFMAPYWLIVAALSIYPTIVFIRGPYRRYRRRKRGCCENCGYNLIGNTSGVCPECGTVIAAGTNA